MPIYELDLENIGPFGRIHFDFDPQVNVFIGPNNCGKSTTQMALADIAVYGFTVPPKIIGERQASFTVVKGAPAKRKNTYHGQLPIDAESRSWPAAKFSSWGKSVHEIGYACYIPALRESSDYRAKSAGSEAKRREDSEEIEMGSSGSGTQYSFGRHVLSSSRSRERELREQDESFFRMGASVVVDDQLIQRMIDLDYRGYREEMPRMRAILEKIGTVASEIMEGFPIAFRRIAEDHKGLYPEFETPDGNVPINVLSQGTQSLIQWVGLLLIGYAEYYHFPRNIGAQPGVVIIDEVDAHMHPSWQRRILPTLARHFPNLQIFCSSHSPFVLAGLKAGQAQLLRRDTHGKLTVSRNQQDIVGWSSDQILRHFLDMANPTDAETSRSIEELRAIRGKKTLSHSERRKLGVLRSKVSRTLLDGPVAAEVERFAELLNAKSSAWHKGSVPNGRTSTRISPRRPRKSIRKRQQKG